MQTLEELHAAWEVKVDAKPKCQAEVSDYIGRWPHWEQCSKPAKHNVDVVMLNGGPMTAHICGVHRRVLERGGSLSLIVGPRAAKYPYDFDTVSVRKPPVTAVLDGDIS